MPDSNPLDDLISDDPAVRAAIRTDPASVLEARGLRADRSLPDERHRERLRLHSLIWQDGKILPRDRFRIDPFDEGLCFGRGVWESTRTVRGVPWLWPGHLDRLLNTAALLAIPLYPARVPSAAEISKFVRSLTFGEVVLRLNATAGNPGRPGVVWMTAGPHSPPPESIRLQSVPLPMEKGQPYLLWKTFHYAARLHIGQRGARAGFESTLLYDADGCILEAAHANVFARFPDGWCTPPADGGLLPGTVRQHLLRHSPLPIRERPIRLADLGGASEVFLSNSNVGLIPVSAVDALRFPVGPETRRLIEWLEA